MKLLSKMLSFTLVKDGKDGEDGKPGKPGPIIYPKGKWDKNIEYTSDEHSRPFVEYKGEFYFLNSEKAPIGVDPATDVAQNKGNWVLMEKFKAIFAEILFSDFANLGDFIIFGEYIMSTWGRDIKGNVTDKYKDFPDNFFPNLLINASTGKIIANDGIFKGTIEAKNGVIGGFNIGKDSIGIVVDEENVIESEHNSLAIYKDFFRVGGNGGGVIFANNMRSKFLGAITQTGFIFNRHKHVSGISSKNIGLQIDVEGAKQNIGIDSNASIISPAFIRNRIKYVDLSVDLSELNFAESDTFMIYSNRKVYTHLPDKELVKFMFNLLSLPKDFAVKFTVIGGRGTSQIQFKGVANNSGKWLDYEINPFNVATFLGAISPSGELYYQILHYRT